MECCSADTVNTQITMALISNGDFREQPLCNHFIQTLHICRITSFSQSFPPLSSICLLVPCLIQMGCSSGMPPARCELSTQPHCLLRAKESHTQGPRPASVLCLGRAACHGLLHDVPAFTWLLPSPLRCPFHPFSSCTILTIVMSKQQKIININKSLTPEGISGISAQSSRTSMCPVPTKQNLYT